MTDVELMTPGGLFLGQVPGYNVDLARLDRVAARIVTGLFYHEFGNRLPSNHQTIAYSEAGLTAVDKESIKRIQSLCARLTTSEPKAVGTDVFHYWFEQTRESPNVSAWLLTFFKHVSFLCVTMPREARGGPQNRT
jgi:hypothetical protein